MFSQADTVLCCVADFEKFEKYMKKFTNYENKWLIERI